MAKGEIHLVVTMDCERLSSESYRADGTPSWEMSKLAITGLAQVLESERLSGSFLPTPEAAARHSSLFAELAGRGFEVGMQFHCDSFRRGEYTQVLGSYAYAEQMAILTAAKADWEDALGTPLLTYRSGYLSGSDDTFPILAELGVKQTSVSKPGRWQPDIAARWYGAIPYAHRPSADSRLQVGDLDIVEVPLSSHPGERFAMAERFDAKDPRPDSRYAPEVYRAIVDGCFHEMDLLQPKVKSFVVITHNVLDYTSSVEPSRRIMLDLLSYIKDKESEGWQVVPSTLAGVRAAYLA